MSNTYQITCYLLVALIYAWTSTESVLHGKQEELKQLAQELQVFSNFFCSQQSMHVITVLYCHLIFVASGNNP